MHPFQGCAPGPAALDLLDVTLPERASYYALLPTAFTSIVGSLPSGPRRKYRVYWDAIGSRRLGRRRDRLSRGMCHVAGAGRLLVTLTAKAEKGSRFAGWSGACRGRGKCYVTVGNRSAVKARFISVRSSPRG